MIQRVVVAGVLVRGKKALIIKRSKNDYFPGVWELPSGKLELGENPNKGVIREFKEETGITVKSVKPISVSHFMIKDRHCVQINYLVKSKSAKVKLSNEHQDFKWVTLKEIEKIKTFKDIKNVVKAALS